MALAFRKHGSTSQRAGARLLHSSFGGKHFRMASASFILATVLTIPAWRSFAQTSPTITSVDPTSGKVNDNITVTGQNLGRSHVSAVFLSDDKTDYRAVVVQQADDKIVLKVPQVKPGSYNVSIQEGAAIYIQPVRFSVE